MQFLGWGVVENFEVRRLKFSPMMAIIRSIQFLILGHLNC